MSAPSILAPNIWLAVAVGGAIGAVARHGVGRAALHFFGPAFPWGTLTVNAVGSFAMGVLVHWLAMRDTSQAMRAFLTVGLLGAFTTFSTFSLDAVALYRDRSLAIAALYVAASLVLSVGGLIAGLTAARMSS